MIEKSEASPLDTPLNPPPRVYGSGQAYLAGEAGSTSLRSGARPLFRAAWLAGAILILWLVFWVRIQSLMVSEWGYDQGFYLLVAHLMERGFVPYQEIHMSEPPMMVWSINIPLQLFGSIWGMRFAMLGFTLVAVAATISIGQKLGGRLAGWLAGGILVFNNEFFGTTVDPGIPSISLALVAIVLALRYQSTQKSAWLGLSAIAMAGSFLLKLYMLPVIPLIILIIYLAPQETDRPAAPKFSQFWRHTLLWGGVVGLVMLGVYLIYGLPTLLDQTIFFHLYKSEAYPWNPWTNLAAIWPWFLNNPLLLGVSLYSLSLALVQPRRFGWIILSWALFTLIYLAVLNPLRTKHLFMLIPLQAILAGLALSQWLTFKRQSGQALTWGVRVVGLILTLFLFIQIFSAFTQLDRPVTPMVDEQKQPIVEALVKFTTPSDCIITDDPYIAIVSGRLPPPWLSNLSYARFESGSLKTEDLMQITETQGCQAVVPTFDRLKNSDRAYYDWAKTQYLRTWVVDGKEIMVGKSLTEANPMIPAHTKFQDQVTLLGLDWVASSNSPNDRHAYLSLYWQTLKPFSQNYKIFVQLRDAAGQTVTGADHEVFDGLLPAQVWPVNRILKDTHRISISPDILAGPYTLYVGLYDPATLERLPVANDSSGENAAVFSGIVLP